jgi:hypothetical protein
MDGGTATQALAEVLLGEPVQGVIRRLRADGLSWQGIADQLRNDTDGILDLNRETYRLWSTKDLQSGRSK